MSWRSHLVVVFDCGKGLNACASEHSSEYLEARWFLEEMAELKRSGTRILVTWGKECNHLDVDKFIKSVVPFFEALYKHWNGIAEYSNVMIFHEVEQKESADAYQLSWFGNEILIKEAKGLPFTWGVW